MAVLIIADVPGQTHEGYDGMLEEIEPLLHEAKGFIAHGAGPSVDGWKTFEVWESAGDATAFFAAHVHPNLPPGVRPRRTIVELHALFLEGAPSRRDAEAQRTRGGKAFHRRSGAAEEAEIDLTLFSARPPRLRASVALTPRL